jgi:hypothetical protein
MDGARRKAISVMFMTFIAVSILAATFITMYLYLTQHNLTATEAQRIYAEAAQERIDSFYYPPASEASVLRLNQRLVIYNRGIGSIIKYIFAFKVQETPLNSGNILLRSGENISIMLDTLIPDDEEVKIVTERGSIFVAQVGYFNVTLDPEELQLYPSQIGISVLRIMSRNYESRLNVRVIKSDVSDYELVGKTDFYLTRNGVYSITVKITAPEDVGAYSLSIVVEEPATGYSKEANLRVNVQNPPPAFAGGIRLSASDGTNSNNPIPIDRPGTGLVGIYAYSIGGYSGSIRLEARSIERLQGNRWMPASGAFDITFNPNPVEVTPEQPGTSIMSIYVPSNAPKGLYRVMIAGIDEELNIDLDLLYIYVRVY